MSEKEILLATQADMDAEKELMVIWVLEWSILQCLQIGWAWSATANRNRNVKVRGLCSYFFVKIAHAKYNLGADVKNTISNLIHCGQI